MHKTYLEKQTTATGKMNIQVKQKWTALISLKTQAIRSQKYTTACSQEWTQKKHIQTKIEPDDDNE